MSRYALYPNLPIFPDFFHIHPQRDFSSLLFSSVFLSHSVFHRIGLPVLGPMNLRLAVCLSNCANKKTRPLPL